MKRFASLLLVVLLLCGVASAETLSLSGTVEAGVTLPVIAPIASPFLSRPDGCSACRTIRHVSGARPLFTQ